MAAAPFRTSLRHLLRSIGPRPTNDLADAALLARFVAERDEAAFAALVRRHGPMVLGVCRRVLRHAHDADDVFQATFLVLARKAARLDGRRPLAGWLYIVARNLALKLRARAACRRTRDKEIRDMITTESNDQTSQSEACEVLDAELGRLPEKYRAPLVLCHLQGMTHEAAAKELGWPVGSMAGRLARGQELLRERLLGRGVWLSAAALAALLTEQAAAVSMSTSLEIGRAAALFAAGNTSAGSASAAAVALAGGALKAMSLTKLKIAAALVVGLGILAGGAGAGLLAFRGGPAATPALAGTLPSPSPAVAAKEEREAEPIQEEAEARRLLRRKLDTRCNLERGIGPGTRLQDALEFFDDRYELNLFVDTKAFAAAGDPKIHERPVQLPGPFSQRLSTALRLVLRQVELENGLVGGYRIKGNVLEIVPVEPTDTDERRLPRNLRRRFLRPVRWDKELPEKISVARALEMIATRYGERLTIDAESFKSLEATQPKEYGWPGYKPAGAGEGFSRKLAGEELCLGELLDGTLETWLFRMWGGRWISYVVTYQIKPDGIVIKALKPDSSEAIASAQALEVLRDQLEVQQKSRQLARKLDDEAVNLSVALEAKALKYALELVTYRFDPPEGKLLMPLWFDSPAFAALGIKVEEVSVKAKAALERLRN